MGWINFEDEKPEKMRRIAVKGFQNMVQDLDDDGEWNGEWKHIIDSGVGTYEGIRKDLLFGNRELICLSLSNREELIYSLVPNGSKYREPLKNDCDFEWIYLD